MSLDVVRLSSSMLNRIGSWAEIAVQVPISARVASLRWTSGRNDVAPDFTSFRGPTPRIDEITASRRHVQSQLYSMAELQAPIKRD